jgi:exopolysaccharide biosynthesis polyprenyl glycosylphosphotransferase
MATPDALQTQPAPLRGDAPGDIPVPASAESELAVWRRDRARRLPPVGDSASAEAPNSDASTTRDALRRRLLALADLLAAAAAFAIALAVLGDDSLGIWGLVAIGVIVPVFKLAGLYDRDEHLLQKTTLDEAPALFYVATLYTLLAFVAGDAIVYGVFGRDQALLLWGLLFALLLLMRTLARHVAARLVAAERCLIVGSAPTAHSLVEKLERSAGEGVRVVGRVPLSPDDAGANELPVLGDFGSLRRLLTEHRVDRVLIAPGLGEGDRLPDAIRVVKRLGVRISVLPRLSEAVGSAYEFDEVEGATMLGLRRHGLSRSSQLIKRGFDLVGAVLALTLLAPPMAAIALAIKLDSRGPMFFRQRRVGRGDETFQIYKFRTMVDGAEAQRAALAHRNEARGGLFKIEEDPRVTRVGRLLRRSSLDELPQLLNVLRGEMSLVGPRPLVVDEDSLIEGLHRHRLLVPPGATGLWQIFGSARIPLEEMVKIDYLYGANWSLWLDVKILLRTVPFVLARRGL